MPTNSKAFDSLLDPPLTGGGYHNTSNPLPSGAKTDMSLPQTGLISAGFPEPTSTPQEIMDAGTANFGLAPSSSKGSMNGGGSSNLLDSPFDTPLKAKS